MNLLANLKLQKKEPEREEPPRHVFWTETFDSVSRQYHFEPQGTLSVEKFTGSNNFGLWRADMMDALVFLDLEETLGEKPVDVTDKQWAKKNRLAIESIQSSLDMSLRVHFQQETSAKELWKKLEEKYLVTSRIHLKRKLYQFNMKKGTSLRAHLDEFEKLLADLVNHDEIIEDEDTVVFLLNSLPSYYESLVLAMIHSKSKLVYGDVAMTLRSVDFWKNDRDEVFNDDVDLKFLVASGQSTDRKFGAQAKAHSKSRGIKGSLDKDECGYCHDLGHWIRDCPKLNEK